MSPWLRVIDCMLCVALGIRASMSHASERMNNLPSSLSYLCKLSIRGKPFLSLRFYDRILWNVQAHLYLRVLILALAILRRSTLNLIPPTTPAFIRSHPIALKLSPSRTWLICSG